MSQVRMLFGSFLSTSRFERAEIRRRAVERQSTALGDKFDYRAFHDTVLGGGALPMPVLQAKVRRWIEAQA